MTRCTLYWVGANGNEIPDDGWGGVDEPLVHETLFDAQASAYAWLTAMLYDAAIDGDRRWARDVRAGRFEARSLDDGSVLWAEAADALAEQLDEEDRAGDCPHPAEGVY